MNRIRVIPILLIQGSGLYKTIQFKSPNYLGDPINAIKIFNNKEVDEIIVLDIGASKTGTKPNYKLVEEMASECFMPLGYGGGIKTLDEAKRIFDSGVEKIILNTSIHLNIKILADIASLYGSQSVVASIDVKKNFFGKKQAYISSGTVCTRKTPLEFALNSVNNGAGELIIQSIDNDGKRNGYDISLIKEISSSVDVPVVACGGANSIDDFYRVVKEGGASAVAAGSMFNYKGSVKSILINYPDQKLLMENLYSKL